MYKAFYGLDSEPFVKTLKTNELFYSSEFRECISRLEYMSKAKGIILLSGEPGTGKSTVLRAFSEKLNPNHFKVIYIPLSSVSRIEFYRQLNHALGGEFFNRKSDLFLSIQKLLIDYAKNSKIIPIIIFDDLQYLKSENLHELQMLLNFDMDSYDPALVVISAHPYLKDKLARPAFSSIEQRILLKYHLSPLNEKETKEYIQHSLSIKGRKDELFNENAYLSVFKMSNGVKRLINRICLKSLMYGVTKKAEIIDEEIVYLANQQL